MLGQDVARRLPGEWGSARPHVTRACSKKALSSCTNLDWPGKARSARWGSVGSVAACAATRPVSLLRSPTPERRSRPRTSADTCYPRFEPTNAGCKAEWDATIAACCWRSVLLDSARCGIIGSAISGGPTQRKKSTTCPAPLRTTGSPSHLSRTRPHPSASAEDQALRGSTMRSPLGAVTSS